MPVYKILFLICLWKTLPFFYSSLRELIIFCIISFNHRFKYDGYPWWLHSLLQRRYQYKLNSTVDTHTNTHTHTHTHTHTSHQKAKVCDICMVWFFQPPIHCSPNLALTSLGQTNERFTHKGAKNRNEIQVWYNLMSTAIEDLKLINSEIPSLRKTIQNY